VIITCNDPSTAVAAAFVRVLPGTGSFTAMEHGLLPLRTKDVVFGAVPGPLAWSPPV